MAVFDIYPELPLTIDVGADLYYLGSEKPIELVFKDRKQFLNTFSKRIYGFDTDRIEYLFRKYLYFKPLTKRKFRFADSKDKPDLIQILEKRLKQIKQSNEFTSSILKYTGLQRNYDAILLLLQQLKDESTANSKSESNSTSKVNAECNNATRIIKEIPQEHLFQIMLEIAWYLLHPDSVPKSIQCNWAKIITKLNTLRIGDIVGKIRMIEKANKIPTVGEPFNYFKRINIGQIAKKPTRENALKEAQTMALQIQGELAQKEMVERLKILLELLETKKYLNKSLPLNVDGLQIISGDDAEKINKSLISNPMHSMVGGNTLDKPLGVAMQPLFNYFKVVYDPIYTLLENATRSYIKRSSNGSKSVILPQLLTLLHITNNLDKATDKYGVYKIKNVGLEILTFVNDMLSFTNSYVMKLGDKQAQNNFNLQLFKLPKIRLSSMVSSVGNSAAYKDPLETAYILFFTVDTNLILPETATTNPDVFSKISTFFTKNNLYIFYTDSQYFETIPTHIPANLFEIDYNSVELDKSEIAISPLENYFKTDTGDETLFIDELVKLVPYVVYNDAELALSILQSFKELMPM